MVSVAGQAKEPIHDQAPDDSNADEEAEKAKPGEASGSEESDAEDAKTKARPGEASGSEESDAEEVSIAVLSAMTCVQLREQLSTAGLETKGRKAELVERLHQTQAIPGARDERSAQEGSDEEVDADLHKAKEVESKVILSEFS